MDGCTPAYIQCIAVEDKPVVTFSSSQGHDCMAALRRAFDVSLSRISQFFYIFLIYQGHDCMAALQRTFDISLSRISQLLRSQVLKGMIVWLHSGVHSMCIAVEDKPVLLQLLYASYDLSIESIVIFIVLRLVTG